MKLFDFLWALFVKLPVGNRQWARALSAIFWITARSQRISYDAKTGLFTISENGNSISIARRSRARLYHRGIAHRICSLADSYDVPELAVSSGSLVVDCGANVGEFSRAMEAKGAIVHAFEPDPLEFGALQRNLLNEESRAWNTGCWSETTIAQFERANDSGDSVVLSSESRRAGLTPIKVIALDDWAKESLPMGTVIDLLKLEAEGGEHEVLLGATELLKNTRFICADLGEGTDLASNTVAPVVNLLLSSSFEVLSFSRNRCMTVFRNTSITTH